MNRTRIFLLIIIFMAVGSAWGVDAEVHEYMDKTGETTKKIRWSLERGDDHFTLTWKIPGETHITTLTPDYGTVRWEMHKPGKGTEIVAERQNDILTIQGTIDGEKTDERIEIDGKPWYQAISLSLRPFVSSEEESEDFWTIRPDEISVYKIRARKLETETLALDQSETRVQKVKLSLTGLSAALWKCFYWFAEDTGVWVRYEGPTGPPGWPTKIITLHPGS